MHGNTYFSFTNTTIILWTMNIRGEIRGLQEYDRRHMVGNNLMKDAYQKLERKLLSNSYEYYHNLTIINMIQFHVKLWKCIIIRGLQNYDNKMRHEFG